MHFKPKKSLGQNFLVDKNIQRKIISSVGLKPSDIVLEIGAGRGELTGLMVPHVKKLYAIEIDSQLCEVLKENLGEYPNINIINKDILKFNLRSSFYRLAHKIKVIGNIPYYISSPTIEHLINFRDIIGTIFITVQKEFAQRLSATAGTKAYGALSCFVQYYTEIKGLFHIKKNCFSPVPKVDSTFIELKIRPHPPVRLKREDLYFKIIRASFSKRRKTLRNSLQGIIPQKMLNEFFSQYSIDSNIRPEDLTLTDFAHLANL